MLKVDNPEGVLNSTEKQQTEDAVAREMERLKQAATNRKSYCDFIWMRYNRSKLVSRGTPSVLMIDE